MGRLSNLERQMAGLSLRVRQLEKAAHGAPEKAPEPTCSDVGTESRDQLITDLRACITELEVKLAEAEQRRESEADHRRRLAIDLVALAEGRDVITGLASAVEQKLSEAKAASASLYRQLVAAEKDRNDAWVAAGHVRQRLGGALLRVTEALAPAEAVAREEDPAP